MDKELKSREETILVVDDEETTRQFLERYLGSEGYKVLIAPGGKEALDLLRQGATPTLIILDILMPQMDGLETLRRLREMSETLPVIVLSAMGQTGTVVNAMKMKASDYLTKPFEPEELLITIEKVLEKANLIREIQILREKIDVTDQQGDFITINDEMIRIKEMIHRIADTDATVLIQGESGVGKELVARAIHNHSPRKAQAIVRVNCAALPSELLESELFGFEKGAFTGAMRAKLGKFELANGGTIFLDEIAEMSPGLQAKLLHALQDGEFSKLGGKGDVRVDVRVIAATNQNLEQAIVENRFREDLYYRLNVVRITVPPLRDRKEDLPILCEYFFKKFKAQYRSDIEKIPDRLMNAFVDYSWPGNVRELENMIRRFVVLREEKYVLKDLCLPSIAAKHQEEVLPGKEPFSLKEISKKKTAEVEKEAILRALINNNWNKKRTAKELNISYRALQYKVKEYGLRS
jgi:two-component system response regulator AtoC